jgi:hypothetical protein
MSTSVYVLNILFQLIGMCSPIQEYLFDSCIGEKLEGIFDQRSVCKRDKTLHGQGQCHGIEYTWRLTVQMTLCYV